MRKVILILALLAVSTELRAQGPWPSDFYFPQMCRWFDTREWTCVVGSKPYGFPCPVGPIRSGETRSYLIQAGLTCQGSDERPVPLDAQSVIVNVTARGATSTGYLTFFDPTNPRPRVESIWFEPAKARTQTLIVTLGQNMGQLPGQTPDWDFAIYARLAGKPHSGRVSTPRDGTVYDPSEWVHVTVDFVGYTCAWLCG